MNKWRKEERNEVTIEWMIGWLKKEKGKEESKVAWGKGGKEWKNHERRDKMNKWNVIM